ncbi:MAG TPA: dihydroorotate dehydrogenase-like protein [Spirochaetia bacterium]|nr:dihydroorotate dehydrogenase-like protein [Spirochaetia bacterium]
MLDLGTRYMGLALDNPLIAGSSALTASVDGVKQAEKGGVGALVLKSIFEEEIAAEYEGVLADAKAKGMSLESYEYYDYQVRGDRISTYVELVRGAKKAVRIPVIASINCTYSHEWVTFAKELEAAGADGIELNMFFLPSDLKRSSAEREKDYLAVIDKVLKQVRVPVALKISPYFSTLAQMIQKLSGTGVRAIVLFNRFYSIDFDIEKLALTSGPALSNPSEISLPLRWVALTARRAACDLAGSTGVHDSCGLVKMLLAGARAVQVASVLATKGPAHAAAMLSGLREWMERHGFKTLEDFRGKLSQAESEDPAAFERVQFMRHYS